MNKIKTISVLVILLIISLVIFILLRMKYKEDFRQKVILAESIHNGLNRLMVDIYQARKGSFKGVPADGSWHNRIEFDSVEQGSLEYIVIAGRLFKIQNGQRSLIADNITDLEVRRQKQDPDMIEVQIVAHQNATLKYNLRLRLLQ